MKHEFALAEAVEVLERTPAVLRALLGGLPDGLVHARAIEGTWTPHEVVAHLIHGENTDWIPRAKLIVEFGASKTFPAFDRDGHRELATGATTEELLDEFAARRAASLEALRELDPGEADLDRRGRHPSLGTVTLRQLLATWTAHDLNHLDQIARALAERYRGDVGAWDDPDYLGILHRRKG